MRIVSGEFKGRQIKSVPGQNTRPTLDKVKESLFNIIGPYFEGGACLDLFAGSGNLGLEALSRGMDNCVFIDRNYKAFKVIQENVNALGLYDQSEVHKSDAFKALNLLIKRGLTFDMIFLDPPYKNQKIDDIISIIEEHDLLNDHGIIVAEYSKEDMLKSEFGTIKSTRTQTYGITNITIYIKEVE